MLFGMGMALSPEEDEQLANIVRPCYASLALANDYFSFAENDRKRKRKAAPSRSTQSIFI